MFFLRALFVFALPVSLVTVMAQAGERSDFPRTRHHDYAPHGTVGVSTCSIEAMIDVKSVHIIIGGTEGQGYGEITCTYDNGHVEVLPVEIETRGVGVGFGVSHTQVHLLASGVGVVQGGAMSLTGSYAITRVGGQFDQVGGELGIGMTANRDGFAIPLAVMAKNGVGLEIAANFGEMVIYAAE